MKRLDIQPHCPPDGTPVEEYRGSLAGETRDGYRVIRTMPGFDIFRKGKFVCHVEGWMHVPGAIRADRDYRAVGGR